MSLLEQLKKLKADCDTFINEATDGSDREEYFKAEDQSEAYGKAIELLLKTVAERKEYDSSTGYDVVYTDELIGESK